ncbi:hypothetical protein [Chishuiella changwenlii]|uniref:hypothetical protein n=1 Tax=Chishuiella changwenlii TaxID=1434701 RepID=UPI002FD92299
MEVLIYGAREIDILDVSISDILNAINKDFSLNYWSILWIDAISKSNKFNILEIEENVNKKKNILNFNYKDLMNFNEDISIYNELFLIGNYEKNYNPIHKTDAEIFENNDIAIELIDNSFWVIKTKNIDLINSLMKLPGAKIE